MWIVPILAPVLIPILIVPFIIGVRILLRSAPFSFAQMLGVFALKPLVTTPFWFQMMELVATKQSPRVLPDFVVLAAPGMMATLGILLVYRTALTRAYVPHLVLILILDCVRWSSSSYSVVANRPYGDGFSTVLCLVMPTIFAVVAWYQMKAVLA